MAGVDGPVRSWVAVTRVVDCHEHGGRIYEYAVQTGRPWLEILDCSANIHPFGPPDSVVQAIQEALPGIRHYPDGNHGPVREVLSRRFSVPVDSLLCGNGAAECLDLLVRHLRPRRCVVLDPSFSEYAAIAKRHAVPVERVSLHDGARFALPVVELDARLQPGDLLFFNQPHNPSGCAWPLSVWMSKVAEWAESGISVVVDESFIDFLPDADVQTAIRQAVSIPRLYVVRSATKKYAIPGLRFGFAAGRPEVMADMQKRRDPWSVNHLAQAAAAAAYQDRRFDEATRVWLESAHRWLHGTWEMGRAWTVFPTAVNFFLVRFGSARAAREVQDGLRREGIFVRSCAGFAGLSEAYVRVALRTPGENERVWSSVLQAARASDVTDE